jgi:hypothetical protein
MSAWLCNAALLVTTSQGLPCPGQKCTRHPLEKIAGLLLPRSVHSVAQQMGRNAYCGLHTLLSLAKSIQAFVLEALGTVSVPSGNDGPRISRGPVTNHATCHNPCCHSSLWPCQRRCIKTKKPGFIRDMLLEFSVGLCRVNGMLFMKWARVTGTSIHSGWHSQALFNKTFAWDERTLPLLHQSKER